ncbi:hypothetical protein KJ966_18835 [bacterium]|nr:hypothetical protein [bacterium]
MEEKRKKIRYMKELTVPEQMWLAKAVITIFLADNIVEDSQVLYMKRLSEVFLDEEPRDTLKEISRLLKTKEIPVLEKLEVEDPEHLIFMLNTLVTSIFANERKSENEVKNYFIAGLKLGVTYEVLMLKLTYQKERFRIKMAQKQVDSTIREIVEVRKQKKLRKQ